ncbi:FAD-dependent monooxygenase [Streptomyces sp. NPDC102451]|uniref:FAD-dependent monooxygenase n=1 Tax=Streptomyces sp. NPDC102451 TaxID=3366177 RepID=UPI0038218EE0
MDTRSKGTVLVSGASIAGPALAYWLDRSGFRVTLVEKADGFRGGGYPIDIRGTALQVTDRMGITEQLRAAHVDTRKITFHTEAGRKLTSIRPEAISGGVQGRDIEVPRGTLATALTGALGDGVDVLFGDSIAALDQHTDHVDVTFTSGRQQEFDLVIGADGLHSNTRRLAFGPEEPYHRYLGACFAGFSIPNEFGMAHEALMWNAPGRTASMLCPADSDTLHAFLIFQRGDPPLRAHTDPDTMRRLVADTFAGDGWHIPRMVEAMLAADDLFFDVVSQIHMPTWSQGRVALAGDAAHATSFMSGQGSSTALVGAYLLAGHLATHSNHTEAFTAYEQQARPFAELNQALADEGKRILAPSARTQFWFHNQTLRLLPLLARTGIAGRKGRTANSALDLPQFTP